MSGISDECLNLIAKNLVNFEGIYGIGKLSIRGWEDKDDELMVTLDSENSPGKYYLDSCIEYEIVTFFKNLFEKRLNGRVLDVKCIGNGNDRSYKIIIIKVPK
jgi:hypothetical protein